MKNYGRYFLCVLSGILLMFLATTGAAIAETRQEVRKEAKETRPVLTVSLLAKAVRGPVVTNQMVPVD
jgi:hypothetical protein